MKTTLTLILVSVISTAGIVTAAPVPAIIPVPARLNLGQGELTLSPKPRICTDDASRETGEFLAGCLRRSTGFPFKVEGNFTGDSPSGDTILFTTNHARTDLGDEGYDLSVTSNSIVIRASGQAGLFYGAQTLLQLLPLEVYSSNSASGVAWKVPLVQIEDLPRFKWRGLMLDVSRHFFNKDEVERLLDEMAMHKMNTFHWHLTDDQGWRIEIKKYPKLTQIGAWRPGIGFGMDPKSTSAYDKAGRYGGFYTQDDVREVVAYATARHINIVPEIEMPGHASAALSAYPEFSCTGGPFEPPLTGGVFNGISCAANDATFKFLDDVITEVV